MFLLAKPAERCGPFQIRRRRIFPNGEDSLVSGPKVPRKLAKRQSGVSLQGILELEIRSLPPRLARVSPSGLCAMFCVIGLQAVAHGQQPVVPALGALQSNSTSQVSQAFQTTPLANSDLSEWQGMIVKRIEFKGVAGERSALLAAQLAQQGGAPLTPENLKRSIRQLYATGLYDSLNVSGEREANGLVLVFDGTPRTFTGTVDVDGASGATMNTQLLRASQIEPGSRLTQSKLLRAVQQMRATLGENGYHEAAIAQTITPNLAKQLADVAYRVASGPRARVGKVTLAGDSGITLEAFRRCAHLRLGANVDHDTINHALDGVLKQYQHQGRLEADVKLESAQYDAADHTMNYRFISNRGPVVSVVVEGANISSERIRRIIPIYQEGSVDEDLLNEGNRRLRDYYQRLGYFDVKVDHEQRAIGTNELRIIFNVSRGDRRRVEKVSITGNHYFDTATLRDLLGVRAADVLDRHGVYSQSQVSADINAIESQYHNNGFSEAKVTVETSTPVTATGDQSSIDAGSRAKQSADLNTAPLAVTYHITEGRQLRVGALSIDGNDHVPTQKLLRLLNTAPGQMLSPQNLAGDHDALATEYYSRGFSDANVTISERPESADASTVDVLFHVEEGRQVYVRDLLTTGLHFTRPSTVMRAITLHPGDALNQAALSETQRNLYGLAIFSEVNVAVENPNGNETAKTILIQASEARRWALTYGFGFEAQTGQPQNNCAGATAGGVACNPNGKTGVSPRVLADITRNDVLGREQSVSVRGTYGLLEQSIGLQYQIPHFEGNRNFGFTFSGGYANSEDVSTYVASRLEGAFRFTQDFNHPEAVLSRANTFIYEIDFRRVKVSASSLQVYPGEISELSTATRVGGPAFTWIRDSRDVPMDARRGTYTSFQEFLSHRVFGAQAQFNRIDMSNSSYYAFDKERFVLARSTRYGQVRAFGSGASAIIPLPERLYAGGAVSLRGFSQNAAGPRDPETGYQIGGAGTLTNNTELRLPPPTLPWFGNTISFVIFHDMGNVFTNARDAWASALRVRQPNSDACRSAVANPNDPKSYLPTGPMTSTGQQGLCSFNDFSHAVGVGMRYHTPVGPIRFDFSYNLNPPIYPVNIDYGIPTPSPNPLPVPGYEQQPYLGQSPHIGFFFSLGQAF